MASQPTIALLLRPPGVVVKVLRDDLGLESCFALGTSLVSLVEGASLPEAVRLLQEIRENGTALDFEIGIVCKSTAVELIFSGYRTERGIHLIAARDTLSRESLLYELTRSVAEPESAFDLSRDALLALTAHELRNHANGVLAASQYLADDAASLLEPEHMPLLRSIEASGRAMLGVIDDVLEVAGRGPGSWELQLTPTDIFDLIQKQLPLVHAQAEVKRVRLELTPAVEATMVLADPVRVQRVIDTLLNIAVAFANSRAKIEISVAKAGANVETSVVLEKPTQPAERLRAILDPSRREIKGLKAATVLAFRIMHHIVEQHGGQVRIEGDDQRMTISVSMRASAGLHARP
jgi:K+-sensing histidine kinase KdpD